MTLSLNADWSLRDESGDYQCAISFPYDGHSALFDAGLIPDPYFGRNEYDLRWICETDWTATRTFTLTDTHVDLVLSCLDTVATVRVNDTIVLEAKNAFRDYRVSLAEAAQVGENTISVTFHSPVEAGRALQDAHPFELPISKNCPIPFGNFLRKPLAISAGTGTSRWRRLASTVTSRSNPQTPRASTGSRSVKNMGPMACTSRSRPMSQIMKATLT